MSDRSFTTMYLNCSRFDTVYLMCSEFSSRKVHGPAHGRHNILCRIDVNTPLGTVLTGAFALNCSGFVGDFVHKNLHFQLTDWTGKLVELNDDSLQFA